MWRDMLYQWRMHQESPLHLLDQYLETVQRVRSGGHSCRDPHLWSRSATGVGVCGVLVQKMKLVATRVFDSVSRFENSVCVNQWIFLELQGRITILGSEVHFVGVPSGVDTYRLNTCTLGGYPKTLTHFLKPVTLH